MEVVSLVWLEAFVCEVVCFALCAFLEVVCFAFAVTFLVVAAFLAVAFLVVTFLVVAGFFVAAGSRCVIWRSIPHNCTDIIIRF